MTAALELIGIILGLGIPITYLAWGAIPSIVIKAIGATVFATATGYAAFMASCFVHSFTTELRRQRKG